MALDGTAEGLRASIAEWLDDPTLADAIPDFITMAEARFNRLLAEFDMEARAYTTTVDGWLTLPDDFGGLRSIFVRGNPDWPLEQIEQGELRRKYAHAEPGVPRAYAITAGQLLLGPTPAPEQVIEVIYWRRLAPLVTNETNWLLTKHPDVYLYACLLAAELRGWNDSRAALFKSAFDEGVAEIIKDGERKKHGAAPLAPQVKRP